MNKFSVHIEQNRYNAEQNAAIDRALDYAVTAHDGQLRASGEPFVTHPLAVAEIVASWHLDYEAVMAALLHDVVEDTSVTADDVKHEFGEKVAYLVDGVTKLRLSKTPRPAADSVRLEESNENLRKLLLATTKDYRVMFIKLADRLHNMRTLGFLQPKRRAEIARESLQVYAPLADRLGMGLLKGELEDLSFKYSQPEAYAELERLVKVRAKKAHRYLMVLKRAVSNHLWDAGVKLQSIEARQKRYYSIYKKLVKVEGDIDKIYDLIAVRVIVPDVSSCYQALGIIHQHYKPLIYRIKDYISVPKPNGYQSLHTTVFAEDGHITEIQIRTPEMHEAAENGLAAHFYYDTQKSTDAYAKRVVANEIPESLQWVNQLQVLQQAMSSDDLEGVKLDLFADRIYVFSPKGDLYELPEGAMPLDFAFAIHSDIGLRALGVKVNGRMVPLDTRLENRDVVEIITRREPSPNRDWLGLVVTNHAKNRIRSWFRSASREANIANGRKALEEGLQVWGVRRIEELPKRAVADALDSFHMRVLDDLLAQIGDGTFGVPQVIRRLFPETAKSPSVVVVKRPESTGRVLVEGSRLPHTLAPCCSPAFPQPLLGYVTRGKGVTVHALGCPNIPTDIERYVTCRWETIDGRADRLVCRIEVRAANRVGLILDVTKLVAEAGLNIAGMTTTQMDKPNEVLSESVISFGLEVPDLFMLAALMQRLERLPGVTEVHRVA